MDIPKDLASHLLNLSTELHEGLSGGEISQVIALSPDVADAFREMARDNETIVSVNDSEEAREKRDAFKEYIKKSVEAPNVGMQESLTPFLRERMPGWHVLPYPEIEKGMIGFSIFRNNEKGEEEAYNPLIEIPFLAGKKRLEILHRDIWEISRVYADAVAKDRPIHYYPDAKSRRLGFVMYTNHSIEWHLLPLTLFKEA
jgi:hypothetical protein